MKKLLLLLFISFALISSANANSIKGAFGYKLGDVDKSIETKEEFFASWTYFARKSFTPKNPPPFFDYYSVSATPISHKIYEIIASKSINEKSKGVQYDRCEYGSGSGFSDLLAMLRARYGDVFEKKVHKSDRGTNLDEQDLEEQRREEAYSEAWETSLWKAQDMITDNDIGLDIARAVEVLAMIIMRENNDLE